MPRYEKAPVELGQIVERMMDRYHPQLRDAKVTIAQLFAFPLTDENGDTKGPALKHNGYPAAAVIKIIGLKERTDGRADSELVIDGDNWKFLSDAQKDALVDHELEHLELKTDKDGLLVRDDLERPKLVIRKHDHQFGWFDAVVRRHGRDSLEFIQFENFQTVEYKQNWLPYLDDPDQTPVIAEPLKEAGAVNESPDAHEGLSVEFSTPRTQSVTITADGFKKLAKNIRRAGFAGKPSRKSKSSGRRMAAAGK
jgi:hypothetical protein